MSGPLAIAAVTAALKDLLNDGMLDNDLSTVGSFSVTSSPPDRITTGEEEPNRLNVFLYQVSPNLGWRNVGLPSRDASGTRSSNPPLALDLHYLLTAYGRNDLTAEILLGYAMQLLHETPILSRDQLRVVLGTPSTVDGTVVPGIFGPLTAVDLADQVELIKITPNYLNFDELSKMWTAMQARYRQSMAYTVSVVLIQSTEPVRAPLPVLKRGADDRGAKATAGLPPVLASLRSAISDSLPALRLGDDLLISGTHLDHAGIEAAVFSNRKANLLTQLPAGGTSPNAMVVHIPSVAERPQAVNEWAIGLLDVTLLVDQADNPGHPLSSNGLTIALAPTIALTPPANPAGYLPGDTVTLTCQPRLQARQEALTSILIGSQSLLPASISTPLADPLAATTLTFLVPAVAVGNYLVRLRVEDIDSLPVLVTGSPPKLDFDPTQKVTVR
jgi:hypothetical protein